MTAAELLILARAYSETTGLSLATVGERACASMTAGKRGGNSKIFTRLALGHGCISTSIDRASRWFDENWPDDTPWPAEVPRPGRRQCAA
jgi:hypothetical protein